MNLFQVHILGASAATPTSLRHTTSQLVQIDQKLYMLDCGEGTQMQLRRFRMPMMKIDHIFISHLHGDHYLGLPGFLFSMHLLGRSKLLHIYSPPGLEEIIRLQYESSNLTPSFPIQFHTLSKGGEIILRDQQVEVETLAMKHRIPTYGFLFRERPRPRNIIKDSIKQYNIPVDQMDSLKSGKNLVLTDGRIVPNAIITTPPVPPRRYAFCSDTVYTEDFLHQITGVDLLYHEATFLHDMAKTAREKTHTTSLEAATLARKANVRHLLLGHYSARYKNIEVFAEEAKTVFPHTMLAEEGMVVQVPPDDQKNSGASS